MRIDEFYHLLESETDFCMTVYGNKANTSGDFFGTRLDDMTGLCCRHTAQSDERHYETGETRTIATNGVRGDLQSRFGVCWCVSATPDQSPRSISLRTPFGWNLLADILF